MNLKHILLAMVALTAAGCGSHNERSDKACGSQNAPISKPEITLSDGVFSPEALWAMGRIGSVVPNEALSLVAYTVSYYSLAENRSTTWVRVCEYSPSKVHTDSASMVRPGDRTSCFVPCLRLLDEFVGGQPAWTNDGRLLYMKGGKVYLTDWKDHSRDLTLTGFEQPIEGFLLSPDNQQILLVSTVKSHPTTADLYPDLPLASGRVVDDLMYKHWDEWVDEVPQPFLCALTMDARTLAVAGSRSLLEGTVFESPMRPWGGTEQLAWSPDSKTIAYTCRKKAGLDYAVSTNSDIYLYDIETGETRNITEDNLGYDTNPAYSPDGQWIAWLSMEHDGYESDENRLFAMDVRSGEKVFLSKGLDSNVDSYYWKDNNTLVFNAVWHGTERIYQVAFGHDQSPILSQLTPDGQYDYELGGHIGSDLICLRHSMERANEIYAMDTEQVITPLTDENGNIYSQAAMGSVQPRQQRTTDGKQMLTWVVYPPHFDPAKKYPTLLFCEGGPQSPVSQFWSYRWNFMAMAAQGYIVVAPNRRGLPGFGYEWNAAISGDYGGQCMRDYLTAIDEICSEPYIDREHLGCVGASFGGFSVYWLAGHHDKRFKAFIAHDGIFNMEMQYLETEEKWFANWDMGGAYWEKDNATAQRTFANSPHRFVDKWDTPILCIHGEKDYRILANQAMAAFDAAKMRGIPAQLLIFPDENHWVLQPQNGILWQRTYFAWLDKWLKE
ncbi:MAG: alpha/beta fold hydrolase [Paludibacteraceae bacterium]